MENEELVDYLMNQLEDSKIDIDLFAKILAREKGYDKERVKQIIYQLGKKE